MGSFYPIGPADRIRFFLVRVLRNGIVPFIITDEMKLYYYRGLREWDIESGYLTDTCFAAQDQFKKTLDYFGIIY